MTEVGSKIRDGVIDSLIIEQAKLKQLREEMIFEILKLKKENGMIFEMTEEESSIFES